MSQNKLSSTDWATIVTLYTRGEKTVRDLAEQFQVSRAAIHEGLNKRGVKKGSKVSDVMKEAEDEAAAAHKARVAAAHSTAERYQKYNELFVQIMVKKIVDSNQSGTLASANAEIIAIKNGMAVLAKARKEAWDMGKIEQMLEQDEELAALNVGEYTEEELDAIKAANEEAYQASMDDMDGLDIHEPDVDDEEEDGDGEAD